MPLMPLPDKTNQPIPRDEGWLGYALRKMGESDPMGIGNPSVMAYNPVLAMTKADMIRKLKQQLSSTAMKDTSQRGFDLIQHAQDNIGYLKSILASKLTGTKREDAIANALESAKGSLPSGLINGVLYPRVFGKMTSREAGNRFAESLREGVNAINNLPDQTIHNVGGMSGSGERLIKAGSHAVDEGPGLSGLGTSVRGFQLTSAGARRVGIYPENNKYTPLIGQIALTNSAYKSGGNPAKTLVHEIVHANTVEPYRNNLTPEIGKLFEKDLANLYEHRPLGHLDNKAKGLGTITQTNLIDRMFGGANPKELAAEYGARIATGDPIAGEFEKDLKLPNFLRAVREVVGVNKPYLGKEIGPTDTAASIAKTAKQGEFNKKLGSFLDDLIKAKKGQ